MLSKIKSIFSLSKENLETNNKNNNQIPVKEEEYVPSAFEILKFNFQFLKIDYSSILYRYIYYIYDSYVRVITPFILLEVKNAIVENDFEKMKYQIVKYMLLKFILQILCFLDTKINYNQNQETEQQVQKSILENILSKDVQFFEDNKITQLADTLKQGSEYIANELSYGNIYQKFNLAITIISKMYFIYYLSPYLLINFLVTCFLFQIVMFLLFLKIEKLQEKKSKKNDVLDFVVDDILNNITVIKTFGTELKESSRIQNMILKSEEESKQINALQQMSYVLRSASFEIVNICLILQIFFQIGLSAPINQVAQSITDIFQANYYGFQLANQIIRIILNKPENYYLDGKKQAGKIMQLFKLQSGIPQDIYYDKKDESQFTGDIVFDNVSFKYPASKDSLAKINQKIQQEDKSIENNQQDQISSKQQDELEYSSDQDSDLSDQNLQKEDTKLLELNKQNSAFEREYVINNLSFKIKQGQYVAFVGKSGCGKSTIIKLLQRYYDTTSGSILFDNQNIRDCSIGKLRRSVGFVSQEPSLFDNDIEYNITYGSIDSDYTDEDIQKVCDMSGVSEFVFDKNRFPKGLKTLVGSKGMKLSGGQKQRIAIARALMKKPKILILDEATSSLDAESEHQVQQQIDKLAQQGDLTLIVVAHRLSTIAKSDKIFVLKHGEIKEEGTHAELLSKNGIYKKLVHYQINFQDKLKKQI
ncbi:ABC transporter family protein (macronuclear) [Tetrahymena thermophila SB210]|uniref:ABC transporter family protein n=1 Tax=Tetrahymena thermophila (strain SB210) TaxID=312017 RepID=W7XHA9_TETTS|nr:ABC transporter family protein [Tetrahymena thermophila SB210]EWS76588.1 ABC transporter family protein [Tetrahymena thermophila SB210]|eukprot:XP_012650874.1 ABC transporter family protein [Tetrahymena thermophila SB210]